KTMMDKIRTIPTTPAVASQAASKAKAAPATSKEPSKAPNNDETPAAEFAAAMLAVAQPQVAQAAQAPKAPVMGADGKTLEAKSSADTTGSASQTAGNMPGVAAQAVTPEMMQARAQGSTGMNAGAMVAGLQPKTPSSQFTTNGASRAAIEGTRSMKEWVFDGVEGNPNLRSLFNAQAGAQSSIQDGVKGAENLLNEVQSEQQGRGEMALDMEKAISNQPMTSSQENSMLQGSGMSLPHAQAGMGLGHVSIERSQQPQVVNANGSSALSGAEYLSTLNMLKDGKAGSGMMSQGESGAGSFGREGGKAGLRAGAQPGEVKKTKLAIGGETGFDAFAQNGAAATGVSGSAMLSGTGTQVTGKSVEGQTSMQAQVTTGSMAQDRIASASLAGMSSNIRNITSQGGGEIRVKLHPENLGELHLRIVTDGKQVGIHVQASDDKARKILEESLSDLKDSLSKHQLSLGSVDFAVGQAQGTFSSDMGNDSRQSQSQQSFSGNMQDMMNGNGNQSNNQWAGAQDGSAARESWNGSPLRTAMPGARMATQAGASQVGMNSAGGVATRRLDIRA
ncbi:MAG: flagellar hook-length control protein FliK, partial [Bdellovibrionia bacterium]